MIMKKINFDNSHIAQDIINQRKEFESAPLSQEEIAELIAKDYLEKKSKKKLIPRSQEQWDEILKKVIVDATTDRGFPEQNLVFLENIPEMHRCWAAISEIGRKNYLAKIYSLVMTKIYRDGMPFEIEKVILALDDEEIIWELAKNNYRWSHRGQRIMFCLHPKAYDKVFAEKRESMAIIFA